MQIHLTGTVSGLRELSLEWPLSTTNKMPDQRNFSHLISAFCMGMAWAWRGPVLCLRLIYYIDLFRLAVILLVR